MRRIHRHASAERHVVDVSGAVEVDRRQSAIAVEHQRPFVCRVPVQFADTARPQTHIHTGYVGGDREVRLVDLARPADFLDPAMHR